MARVIGLLNYGGLGLLGYWDMVRVMVTVRDRVRVMVRVRDRVKVRIRVKI